MTRHFPSWITEAMIEDIKRESLDTYIIALEGWRRGLTLTWYSQIDNMIDFKAKKERTYANSFSLYDNQNNIIHYFSGSQGDKNKSEAINIVANKHTTKNYLQKKELLAPKSVMFGKELEDESILQLAKKLKRPLVVKPTIGNLGQLEKDTVTRLNTDEEIICAINEVRNSYEYDDILVEEQIIGKEYRLYVVGDKVVATALKTPAFIEGNGQDSIESLVKAKNKLRKKNPFFKNHLIKLNKKLDELLRSQGLTRDDILEKERKLELSLGSHLLDYGETIDWTDEISKEIQQKAISAVQSLPGLAHAGVDIIENDYGIFVVEVIANANLGIHLFPLEGESRNVSRQLIDYYFPETTYDNIGNSQLYFDFKSIQHILKNRYAEEITITDAPRGDLFTARYIVSGKVTGVGYRQWIRKQAIKKNLHGYTRNLKNGNVVVIVGSNDFDAVANFKTVCKKGSNRARVKKVKELDWVKPLEIGFLIKSTQR